MKKRLTAIAVLCSGVFAGCLSVTVRDYGYDVVKGADGQPLVAADGTVQTVHKGQKWSYFKHWVNQECEEFTFSRKPQDTIDFATRNYKDIVSPELNKLVETSLKGAAELAAKVGAAIASSGATPAAEGISGLVKKYLAAGGSADKAKVECKDGNCTISDGCVTCSDGGSCTTGACSDN